MADEYTAQIPRIASALFAPNPVNMNTQTLLSVEVVEDTVILEPTWFYTNEIYCGEV